MTTKTFINEMTRRHHIMQRHNRGARDLKLFRKQWMFNNKTCKILKNTLKRHQKYGLAYQYEDADNYKFVIKPLEFLVRLHLLKVNAWHTAPRHGIVFSLSITNFGAMVAESLKPFSITNWQCSVEEFLKIADKYDRANYDTNEVNLTSD